MENQIIISATTTQQSEPRPVVSPTRGIGGKEEWKNAATDPLAELGSARPISSCITRTGRWVLPAPTVASPAKRSKSKKRQRERPQMLSQSTDSSTHPFVHKDDTDTSPGAASFSILQDKRQVV